MRNRNSEARNGQTATEAHVPNIMCPECGAEIALSEAVSHSIREQLATELEERLNTQRGALLAEATARAEEKVSTELQDLRTQLEGQQSKLRDAQAAELGLRKSKREVEEARDNLQLEVARQLDAERTQIADKARQQALEEERLKGADKEEIIKSLKTQIEALQRRAEQGSMQLQGETLEVTLEEDLRLAFPYDEIAEVKKGERGADVIQHVRTNAGLECGVVLWEAKRAKKWSPSWVEKLKEDQREAKAELSVVVTTCPPEGVRGFGQLDGIWVCEPPFACALASALRHGLVGIAVQRTQESGRADKMTHLYDYLCSVEFRQHVEAIVESFKGLKEQLAAERRAFERQWSEREQQIGKALQHTGMLYGSIQGIAGRVALPQIDSLELPCAPAQAHPVAV
ncbi:conserved hypothetical protein [Verrucomicrobia bacterium]|nr:conserved hypothetical protein [Verrucomicrobiota bacterium]